MKCCQNRWRRRTTVDLTFLGLARKAGRVEIGEEAAGTAARAGKAKLLLTASDSSDNAVKRAESFARTGNAPHIVLSCTKEELGRALGKDGPAMVAITDAGFASGILKRLAAENPEQYGEAACRLAKGLECSRDAGKKSRQG